jgi:hypothetical protein
MLIVNASAQERDSLIAIRKGGNWAIKYTIKPGENMHMLAMRFYISDGVLAYANDPDNIKNIGPGSVILIPVTKENYSSSKQPFDGKRKLYYYIAPKDDIGFVSMYAGVTKDEMRLWNNLKGNTLTPGDPLFIGWVKVMALDTLNPMTELAYPSTRKMTKADTMKMRTPGGLDTLYDLQTNHGLNVLTEKGTAVFFEKMGRSNIYQAFHNTTKRGTIIKVFNPGTGKTIYVKVLGPIPDTKQYANCIIGISEAAKEALGVVESKAWCELSYSAN